MKEIEVKASSVEQAVIDGLKELGVGEKDVAIEIINKGGLFKKATVKLTLIEKPAVSEEHKVEKVEKTENSAQSNDNVATATNSSPRQAPRPYTPPKNEETPYDALEESDKVCVDFVKSLLVTMKFNCCLKVTSSADKLYILIGGEDTDFVIGYRGETLDNIQYLCLLVANKNVRFKKKLIVDAEGYREKRAETLTALSLNIAMKVAKTMRAVELEPMNPFERRVIHTALQNDKYVTTSSEGSEPNRYVVISPKDGSQADNSDMYDHASKQNFKKTGVGKTRSFGNKPKKF